MPKRAPVERLVETLCAVMTGPPALAFVPAICLAAFWLGGEMALLLVALGAPCVFVAFGSLKEHSITTTAKGAKPSGAVTNDVFFQELQALHEATRKTGHSAACIAVALDGYEDILDLHGQTAADFVSLQFGDRIHSVIRNQDFVTQVQQNKFLIGLQPSPHLDLEACIQMSGRIQSTSKSRY